MFLQSCATTGSTCLTEQLTLLKARGEVSNVRKCALVHICRYSAVDVPFQIQLQRIFQQGLKRVVFLYDIACKFNIKAYQRCINNPFSPLHPIYRNRLSNVAHMLYKVNKFHIRSHKAACGDMYGLAFTPLVGMRAGEEIETGWNHGN